MYRLNWLRIFTLTVLLSCSTASIFAAPLQFNIGLTPFSGQLSLPNITAVHIDKSGFLWIGTQAGLNRYDGAEYKIFNTSDTSKNWIPASYITKIAEESLGVIWVATYGGGLARYNEIKETFESPSGNVDSKYAYLKSLFLSSTGKIWFGTQEAGIGMYDPVLGRYANWISATYTDLEMGKAEDFVEDQTGNIWVTGNNGLYMIEPTLHSITFHPLPNSISSDSLPKVTAIEYEKEGIIWVGTSAGDVLKFVISDLSYSTPSSALNPAKGWIVDLAYSNNLLWIAKDNGITVVNTRNNNSRTYSHANSLLSSDFTFSLLAEKNSVLVGTARGLNYFSPTPFEKFQSNNSRIFDDVSSFSEGLNGRLWAGTFDGVYILDEQSKLHSPLNTIFKGIQLSDTRVTAMERVGNEMWLGFFHGGVQVINMDDGSTRTPKLPQNTNLAITSISQSKDGSIWIGTYNQGLFQIYEDVIYSYYDNDNSPSRIPEQSIMAIAETEDSKIIIGAENGLYTVDYASGEVNDIDLLFLDTKFQPVITTVAKSENGDVWVGVRDKGIFIIHTKSQSPANFTAEPTKANDGLPSRTIYAIEFDDHGNAWVSTSRGVAKLNRKGELLKLYTTADGLQGNDFNIASSFKDSQGRIYFGGSNGYNRFDPNHSITVSPPPPVVLTRLIIAGDEPQLPVAIHKLESIELSYLDYFVTFEFSVLDYIDPKNNRYRYKLDNFDPEWVENGRRNSATYTNLPAGKYTFRVQGANSGGIWNREGFSVDLVVHPAPWWSWQAYLFYIAVFIVAVLLAKKYYDNIVLRKKATLMAQEMHYAADKATDDLQEQLEFQDEFVKVVHAHSANTLGLVSEFISQQADYVDDTIAREAILNNSHRVAALAQLESCLFYQGDELLANLEDFTNIVISQLVSESPAIAESVITINEMPSQLVSAAVATPLSIVIYELLKNSFHHAFEHSPSANYIHIRLENVADENAVNSTRLKLTVEDNGVGIPDNLMAGTLETSGLAIVCSIAKKLNGTLQISSEKGTSISMTFSTHSNFH